VPKKKPKAFLHSIGISDDSLGTYGDHIWFLPFR